MFGFIRNYKTLFRVVVPFYIPISNVREQFFFASSPAFDEVMFFILLFWQSYNEWYLIVVIIHVSLMAVMLNIFLLTFLPFYVLFRSSAHFLIELLGFTVEFKSSLFILDSSPLTDMWFVIIFSQYIVFLFILLMGFFAEWTLLILTKSNLSIFPFI